MQPLPVTNGILPPPLPVVDLERLETGDAFVEDDDDDDDAGKRRRDD